MKDEMPDKTDSDDPASGGLTYRKYAWFASAYTVGVSTCAAMARHRRSDLRPWRCFGG